MIKLFLDDVRNPDDVYVRDGASWQVVRTVDELWSKVVDLVYPEKDNGEFDDPYPGEIIISLDHDLGDDQPTATLFVDRLEAAMARDPAFRRLNLSCEIHSANPVGVENMRRGLQSIQDIRRGLKG